MAARKIILYTNLSCPWAHRAHIALRETGLDFEQVLIDLDTPREPWYLEINPVIMPLPDSHPFSLIQLFPTNSQSNQAGLVPSLSYNGNIITESAIVAQFIADAHPSHLLPPSGPADNALYRARIRFFIDAFFPKVQVAYMKCIRSSSEAEREEMTQEMVAAIKKGIEPLLEPKAGQGKGPFFGGSEKLTLAEVCISFPPPPFYGYIPTQYRVYTAILYCPIGMKKCTK